MISFLYAYIDFIGYSIEGFILIFICGKMLDKRFQRRTWFIFVFLSFIYAITIHKMNLSPFSLEMPLVQLLLLMGFSFLIGIKDISLRILIISFSVFILETISVLSRFISIYIMDINADLEVKLIMMQILPDVKLVYWSIYLILMIASTMFMSRFLLKIKDIRHCYQYLLAGFIIIVDFLIELLLMMIVFRSVIVSRVVTVLLWAFMTLSVIVLLIAFSYISTVQQIKTEERIILSTSRAISEGYNVLADNNEELRRLSHDFKHHLLVIQNMKPEEVQGYISEITKQMAETKTHIHTGDRYVDVVLNSRMKRIEEKKITFQYHVEIPEALPFSSADICLIVSNQIDNAIEACEKIVNPADRWINYEIKQHGKIWFFCCENSILVGSLRKGQELKTSKNDQEHHGIGLKSLKAIAEHNHGTLQNQIEKDRFISVVSVTDLRT